MFQKFSESVEIWQSYDNNDCVWIFLRHGVLWHFEVKIKKTMAGSQLSRLYTYILCARSRHINPSLGEEGTGAQHEDDVEHSMYWVLKHVLKCFRWRQVVAQTTDWVWSSGSTTSDILVNGITSALTTHTHARSQLTMDTWDQQVQRSCFTQKHNILCYFERCIQPELWYLEKPTHGTAAYCISVRTRSSLQFDSCWFGSCFGKCKHKLYKDFGDRLPNLNNLHLTE